MLTYKDKEILVDDCLRLCNYLSIPIVYIVKEPITSLWELQDSDIFRLQMFLDIENNLLVAQKELLWFMHIESKYPFNGKSPWQYWKENKDNKTTLYKIYIFTGAMKAEKLIKKGKV